MLRSNPIDLRSNKFDWRLVTGAFIVLASRLLTFPRTPWELDEFHFLEAVLKFEPLRHHPHPPGYPLFVFLGKVFHLLIRDPFAALVTLSIVSCVIGWIALYRAFLNYSGDADTSAAAALIFYLSAGMLIHSPLALADATAIMFLALLFHSLGIHSAIGAAIFGSAAIGCRPQLAIPLVPALAVALFLSLRTWRQRAIAIGVFTLVSLLWLVPLIYATGGWDEFVHYELRQARYFAAHDAAASRGSKTLLRVAARFFLRAWGSPIAIAAIGILCAIGVIPFLRRWRREIIPFVVFTFVHLGFAVAAMDPADAVRYSLPALPLFALLAALGLSTLGRVILSRPGRPRRLAKPSARFVNLAGLLEENDICDVIRSEAKDPRQGNALGETAGGPSPSSRLRMTLGIGTAVLAALSFWYVRPILIDRVSGPSPIVAAARFVDANMPRDTVILYQAGTRSHVEWLLPAYPKRFLERAMRELYDSATPAVVLIDGVSTDPDSRVFAWRASEAYTKMTRNFGRRITVDPLRPEERFLRLSGIYHLESAPDTNPWRWLAPDAELRLPPLGKSRVTLTFVLSPDAPYDTNDVQIFVDGREAGRAAVTKTPVRVTVPSGTTVGIRSARSFRPDDVLHNQDRRFLAVQLIALEQQ